MVFLADSVMERWLHPRSKHFRSSCHSRTGQSEVQMQWIVFQPPTRTMAGGYQKFLPNKDEDDCQVQGCCYSFWMSIFGIVFCSGKLSGECGAVLRATTDLIVACISNQLSWQTTPVGVQIRPGFTWLYWFRSWDREKCPHSKGYLSDNTFQWEHSQPDVYQESDTRSVQSSHFLIWLFSTLSAVSQLPDCDALDSSVLHWTAEVTSI